MATKLLVVDDSSIIRRVIIRTLKMVLPEIDTILEAANGVEALEVLGENRVDLILTDINMDDMGGIELISRLKANEAMKDIPVVVVSTEGNETRMSQLLEQGAVGYVKKPFTPEQIRDVLSGIIGGGNEQQ